MIHRKIKIGTKTVETIVFRLAKKNLIILRGSKGYVMCGYLDLRVAKKFGDAAVTVTGVSTIREAQNAVVSGLTPAARDLGIRKNQSIHNVLKIIA